MTNARRRTTPHCKACGRWLEASKVRIKAVKASPQEPAGHVECWWCERCYQLIERAFALLAKVV